MPANLIIGYGRKGTPSREHPGGPSQASKAIKNFDIISTGAQRQALQRYGRVVDEYRNARRIVEYAKSRLNAMQEAINDVDTPEFERFASPQINVMKNKRDEALGTMNHLEKKYRKARKYLDTEWTSAPMSTINEGDEPDPLAAAEQD